MSITPKQLKQSFNSNPQKTAHALAATLRDFGYDALSDDEVSKSLAKLIDGGEPEGIIEMFLSGWLEKGID